MRRRASPGLYGGLAVVLLAGCTAPSTEGGADGSSVATGTGAEGGSAGEVGAVSTTSAMDGSSDGGPLGSSTSAGPGGSMTGPTDTSGSGGSDNSSTGEPSAPTCDDRLLNGKETDIDCGGPTCARCELGDSCLQGDDCSTGICEARVCGRPACDDGVMNGQETDIDCGGADCRPCPIGCTCVFDADCPPSPDACHLPSVCEAFCTCLLPQLIDCDDGVVCTVDDCDPGMGCFSLPDDSACDVGQTCDPVAGCIP